MEKADQSEDAPFAGRQETWLAHELKCQKEDEGPVRAKDASTRNEEDWFDIHDPRNPINLRRREGAPMNQEQAKKMKRH